MIKFEWPQIVTACLYFFILMEALVLHGETKLKEEHSFPGSVIGAAICITILYFGGFWTYQPAPQEVQYETCK